MRSTKARYLLFTIIGGLLLGCAVAPDPAKIGPYPANYDKIVKAYIERTFYDPYSLRSVSISWPRGAEVLGEVV